MTRHYPDLGGASDWLNQISRAAWPLMTRHQYGISALVSQTSFGGETSGNVAKYRLFSHAKPYLVTLFSIAFCFRCRLPNQDHEFRRQMYCTSALGHRWARKVLITFSDKIGVHTVACERSHIPVVASLHPKIWTKHSIPDTNNLPWYNHKAPAVEKADSAIQWINLYLIANAIAFNKTYPLDSELSGG